MTSGTAHWSKDYVEHLRAIHLALLLASLAAIIASRAPDTSKLEAAKHQLHAITDAAANAKSRSEARPTSGGGSDWITFEFNGRHYAVASGVQFSFVERCYAPGRFSFDNARRRSREEVFLSISLMKDISDFRDQWDTLRCGIVTQDAIQVVGSVALQDDPAKLLFVKAYPANRVRRIPLEHSHRLEADLKRSGYLFLSFESDPDRPNQASLKQLQEKYGVKFEDETLRAANIAHSLDTVLVTIDGSQFIIPVEATSSDQHMFVLGELHPEWFACQKSFSECFPELDDVTMGRPAFALNEMERWIDTEIMRDQPKDLDFSGIRFPADDIPRWGIILIFGLLTYFYLHLRELSPKINPEDPGFEVPWIGLYSSAVASLATFVSVLVLPAMSVFMLGRKGLHYNAPFCGFVKLNWDRLLWWILCPCLPCWTLSALCWLCLRALVPANARSSKT
jgi:hypothetical protein